MTNAPDNSSKTEISLKGSVAIVADFFFTSINSILYQRGKPWTRMAPQHLRCVIYLTPSRRSPIFLYLISGIYQPETFKRESKYGLTCLTTTDETLLRYLHNIQKQVTEWLQTGHIQRLVVVVKGVDTLETLERWQFNVSVDDAGGTENVKPNKPSKESVKSIKEIHNEIQAIIRQITASVTFLPLLQEPCTFDLLVYTDTNVAAPEKWADSDPCYILNSAEVKLRSFTTTVHKVDSMVAYKEAEEWEL